VALNCAAAPATLIASELFGYEKGAFTGATARKPGHVEHARGGTLFLDEIGDMPFDLQGLLMRFLQEGEILRVGGRQPIKIDARVVAATNVRLREAITAGKLREAITAGKPREDLYYRLNVLTIHLPPLRKRDGDVEILATCFLREIAREQQREVHGFSPAAMDTLLDYSWPGNVRELIATIRRAVVLADGPLIHVSDLRLEPEQTVPNERPKSRAPRYRRPQRDQAGAGQRRRAGSGVTGPAGQRLQYDPHRSWVGGFSGHLVPYDAAESDRARSAIYGPGSGGDGARGLRLPRPRWAGADTPVDHRMTAARRNWRASVVRHIAREKG
jgi:transcriptional regulator with PAS, ATPase and Fis domain